MRRPAWSSGRRGRPTLNAGGLAIALGLAGAACPTAAGADTHLEATAALRAGGTDNVLLDPIDQRAALVTSGRLGLTMLRTGQASVQTLGYALTAQLYTEPLARSTTFHSLTGSSTWAVGQAGSFNLGATGRGGRMSALDPVLSAQLNRAAAPVPGMGEAASPLAPMASPQTSSHAVLGGRPVGQILFLTGEVHEGYDQGIGRFWHARQLGSVAAYLPLEDAPYVRDSFFLQHLAGADRDLARGSIGGHLRLGQTMTPSLTSPAVVLPASQISFGESWASWTHELTQRLTWHVAGGAYGIWSFRDDRFLTGPVWRGRLTYLPRVNRRYSLEVARSIQPSLLLGYTLRADTVVLEAARALDPAERWSVTVAGNFLRGRQITAQGRTQGVLQVLAARASLRYDPRGPLRYGVDVSRYQQSGDATETLVVARSSQTVFLFLVEALYPARDAPGQRLSEN